MNFRNVATAILVVSCRIASIAPAIAQESPGMRLLDGWRYTRVYCARPTADGGTILAGGTGAYWHHGGDDGLLAKLDADGNFVWKRILGGSGTDALVSVTAADGGGYLAAGSTRSMGYQAGAWLVRFDESGRILWRRSYDTQAIPSQVVLVPSGGYAMSAGQSIVRLSSEGQVLWQRSYVLSPKGYYGDSALVAPTDGGFLFAGGPTCVRTTAEGDVVWTKSIADASIRKACETADGDFILVGADVIFRLDAAGQIVWAMQYESTLADEPALTLTGAQQEPGGEFLVAGSIGHQYWWTAEDRAACMHINASGEIVWQQKLLSDERKSIFYSIEPLATGVFLLGGFIWTMGDGAGEDGLLVRISPSGDAGGCSDLFHTSSFVATPLEVTMTDGDPTVTDRAPPAYVKATGLMATWEATSWSPCAAR